MPNDQGNQERPQDDYDNGKSKPHFTPMWLIGTVYMLLFVIYMGFRQFGHASAAFISHSLIAFAFIAGCAWNMLRTPSQGKNFRNLHVWIGWSAKFSGFFVVASGYYIVLSGDSTLSETAQTVFMATGAFQILVQILMIFFIRFRKNVFVHMMCANILFYNCAFLPAMNRAPQIFGFEDNDWWILASIPIGFVLAFLSIFYYARKMLGTQPSAGASSPNSNDGDGV